MRTFFRLAAEGRTPREIAEYAGKHGWLTKRYRSKRSGKTLGGNAWTPRQVLDLLRNPIYTGCFRDPEDGRRPGDHKAIIDENVFDKVQARIDARRPSRRKPRQSTDFILKGKVFCGQCGRVMSPHTILNRHNRKIRYWHYRCRSHAGGRPPCKGVSVPIERLGCAIRDDLLLANDSPTAQDLSPEIREALLAASELFSASDPQDEHRILGLIVDRVVVTGDDIDVAFNQNAIQKLFAEHVDPAQ